MRLGWGQEFLLGLQCLLIYYMVQTELFFGHVTYVISRNSPDSLVSVSDQEVVFKL